MLDRTSFQRLHIERRDLFGRASRRGVTLLEVVLATALLGLLATLIVQVLVPMGKGSARATQQVELQQTATLAIEQIARDLTSSIPAAVSVAAPGGPPPRGEALMSVQRLETVAADGTQVLESQLVVYSWTAAEQCLWRKTWPPAPPDLFGGFTAGALWFPTASQLRDVTAARNGRERQLARFLKQLDIAASGTTVLVTLSLEAPAPDGKPPERFDLERLVYLRSGLY